MENLKIRLAEQADLEKIVKIYEAARVFMRENGNPTQWKDGYPQRSLLEADIARKNLYVAMDANEVCGVFLFVIGEDPTYSYIEGGTWRSDSTYGTIHRIASCTSGVFAAAVAFGRNQCSHIRVDTHADNKPMQHLAEKHGFSRRGIIYVSDGTPRIAYDLI